MLVGGYAMSVILLTSILLTTGSLVWSSIKMFQLRDRKLVFLTALLGLMLARLLVSFFKVYEAHPVVDIAFQAHLSELPSLGISIMAFIAVLYVTDLLNKGRTPTCTSTTRRLARMAVLLGCFTTLSCFALGYWAYGASRNRMLDSIAHNNLMLARILNAHAVHETEERGGLADPDDLRKDLVAAWSQTTPQIEGSYLCLIEKPGNITIHTKVPKAIGLDVSQVKIESEFWSNVGELLEAGGDWAGQNLDRRGHAQLVGYAHFKVLDAMLVVHTPLDLVEKDLRAAATPWALGLVLIGGLLVPMVVGMLHASYAAAQQATVQAEKERMEMETVLHHSQRLEALGRLAGGIAHDFNNLLTSVVGHVELARMNLEGSPLDKVEMEDNLSEIEQAAQRATRLTHQLLAFSRKQDLKLVSLDINLLVENVQQMLLRLLGEDVKLEVSIDSAAPNVRGDAGLIEQILVNLAVNARDAMPQGGILGIHTSPYTQKQASEGSLPPGDYALIEVVDIGCGMDDTLLDRIFDPFFTTKSHGNGTGLGLSTVYGIVQKLQGRIDVESTVGEGSTFRVYLPAGAATVEPLPVATASVIAEPIRGDGQLILVCEDDHAVRKLTVSMLEHAGYQVVVAENGAETLRLARQYGKQIDLLLTDVILPDTDGHIVARELQQEQPGLKVRYMSGYTGEAIRERDFPHDQVELLNKPFTTAELLGFVAEGLAKQDEDVQAAS
jgi:signal transduction histidine kinase/ActR/RegA family two-component response regulator